MMPNFEAMKVAKPDFFRAITSLTGTTKLTVRNRINHITVTGVSTIELPSVVDAAGMTFAIYAVANAGSDNLTIQDKDDSFNWSDLTLGAVDQSVVVYSDGLQWFIISGTLVLIASVTADAAELNVLDGATATTAEINYLDIGSLGTGAASKAVVLDSGEDYVWPSGGFLTYGGTKITADGAEINLLENSIAGTAVASKVATLGANKELDEFHTAALYIGASAGTLVDATALELNAVADLSARVITLAATTLAITLALHEGRIVVLSHTGAESTATLPAATGSGAVYRFFIGAVNTSNHVVEVASGSDTFNGSVNLLDADGTAQVAYQAGGGDDTITLNGTSKGGAIGDWLEFVDIASAKWSVRGQLICAAGANVADPFSAAV